jgi:hypothetical protein
MNPSPGDFSILAFFREGVYAETLDPQSTDPSLLNRRFRITSNQ